MFTHAQIYIHIYKRESAVDDARRLLCLQLFGASLNDPKTYCLVLQNPLYIYMLLSIYIHVYVIWGLLCPLYNRASTSDAKT